MVAKTASPRHVPIAHGTYKGYQQHLRQGIPTCPDCRAANTARERSRAQAVRTEPVEHHNAAIVHGTYKGYHQHMRYGITPCVSCREANAAQSRRYRRQAGITHTTRINLDTLSALLATAPPDVLETVRDEVGHELVAQLRDRVPA